MGIPAAEAATRSTPSSHIEAMKAMCESIAQDPQVKACLVDDWGRFSNFQIMIYPTVLDRTTTNRLRAVLRKHMPQGAHLREMFGPSLVREWDRYSRVYRNIGYSRKYWMVDIDYHEYDPEANHFKEAA